MRVISGIYKKRKLIDPKQAYIRPTKDSVKETLFNLISSSWVDKVVLDCFAGSGALGIEALSRGAKFVDFVDKEPRYIHKNCEWIENKESFCITKGLAQTFFKKTEQLYNVIFLDPPWDQGDIFNESLKQIFEFDILNEDGIIICEHPPKIQFDSVFNVIKTRKSGKVAISIIIK